MTSRRDWIKTQGLASLATMAGLSVPASLVWAPSAQAQGRDNRPLPKTGEPLAGVKSAPLVGGGRFVADPARVQVYYWWASWCPFCALQSPHMEKLWRAHKDKGLQMLAISLDKKEEDALAYLQKKGYTFPAAMLSPAIERALPKPGGLPVTVVRGKDGRVVMAESGEIFPEDVEQIAKFL
jgi:thiol-disulfide isomerase/thioredoxin